MRQADHVRLVRLGEVVDVDPVGRRGPGRREPSEKVVDGELASRTGRASHEEVVARRADLQAERDSVDRAKLPDRPLKREHVGGGQGQLSLVNAVPQLLGRNRGLFTESLCHDWLLSRKKHTAFPV